MFQSNRVLIAGAVLLLAVLGCASGGSGASQKPTKTPRPAVVTPALEALPAGDSAAGQALFSGAKSAVDGDELGCKACHSLDGSSGVGPSLKGVAARIPEGYASAKAYIYESILEPDKYVRQGFMAGIMPHSFAKKLDGQSLADLIAFVSGQ